MFLQLHLLRLVSLFLAPTTSRLSSTGKDYCLKSKLPQDHSTLSVSLNNSIIQYGREKANNVTENHVCYNADNTEPKGYNYINK